MICKTHKTYRGIRKPTTNCRKCRRIFAWRRFLKFFGVPVAEVRRAPKSEASKVREFVKEFNGAADGLLTALKTPIFTGEPHSPPEPLKSQVFADGEGKHVSVALQGGPGPVPASELERLGLHELPDAGEPHSPEHDAHVARRKANDPELKELEENLRLPIVVPPVIAVVPEEATPTYAAAWTATEQRLAEIQRECELQESAKLKKLADIQESANRRAEVFAPDARPPYAEAGATLEPDPEFPGVAFGVSPTPKLTPELAAQLKLYQSGTLTEHETTALFLKLVDAGVFGGAKPK